MKPAAKAAAQQDDGPGGVAVGVGIVRGGSGQGEDAGAVVEGAGRRGLSVGDVAGHHDCFRHFAGTDQYGAQGD